MLELDLQLFAEDGAQAEAAGTGDVTGAAADAGAQENSEQAADNGAVSFESRQAYEDAVGQRIQAAIQQRFKNQRDLQGQIDSYGPIMQALGMKYGVDAANVDELTRRVTDDDSLYAEEAARLGVTPQMLKTQKALERENARLKQVEQRSIEEQQLQAHFQKLTQQAEQLKQTFPQFDLMRELQQNERFRRYTSPGVGMTVKDAYYALHGEEIARNGMQYAAQQAGQRIAQSVAAGASRPRENGMQGQAPVNLAIDIRNMDKKTRENYARRIRNGEMINFVDKV